MDKNEKIVEIAALIAAGMVRDSLAPPDSIAARSVAIATAILERVAQASA